MRRTLTAAPLLQAARGVQPDKTPVWFMRQAGRSLPEYRDIRSHIGMLEACLTPDILAEITLQPVRRHGVDGAILFSDIVIPLKAAGVDIDIVPGRGPVVATPLRTDSDIASLPVLDTAVEPVALGIDIILSELTETQALIGFVGAPFTLASYLIEGGPSRTYEHTKALMHAEPDLWHQLMEKLTASVTAFLNTQISAGIDAMQLFDSWAGALTEAEYRTYVMDYSRQILDVAHQADIPAIHFGVGTTHLLPAMAEAGPDVLGVDWRTPLDTAAKVVAAGRGTGSEEETASRVRALQGNLDPALLFAGEDVIATEVARIKAEAQSAIQAGHIAGHIFNLGHGVLPSTDPEVITQTVRLIHQ